MLELSPPPALDGDRLRRALQKQYARIAMFPGKTYHLHTGRMLFDRLSYPSELTSDLPGLAVDSFCGVASPFEVGAPVPGQRVLDIGCGSGADALIAARLVGEDGEVLGFDLTTEMARTAELAAKQAGVTNARFKQATAEALPLADSSLDVVLSNGVVNHLCIDKALPWREIARVLKPGGLALVADVVVGVPLPAAARDELALWTT